MVVTTAAPARATPTTARAAAPVPGLVVVAAEAALEEESAFLESVGAAEDSSALGSASEVDSGVT